MKKIFLILSLFALMSSSCDKENGTPKEEEKKEEILDGDLNPEFSTDIVFLTAESGSTIVTSKYDFWGLFVDEIQQNDSTAVLKSAPRDFRRQLIMASWYTLHKDSDYRLVITVKENTASQKREIRIPLGNGNWHGWIDISQAGRK